MSGYPPYEQYIRDLQQQAAENEQEEIAVLQKRLELAARVVDAARAYWEADAAADGALYGAVGELGDMIDAIEAYDAASA